MGYEQPWQGSAEINYTIHGLCVSGDFAICPPSTDRTSQRDAKEPQVAAAISLDSVCRFFVDRHFVGFFVLKGRGEKGCNSPRV
jgi:hypothetical protein